MTLIRRPLPMILAAFVVLALVYAWATPPLEASDELWHFGLVNHLADTGSLPIQNPDVATAWEQEGSQPPLYYLVAAALVKPIDRADFDAFRQPNPHAKAGIPGASDNKNLVLHDTPHPAPIGTALAVYVVRFFGIVLGCVTVAAVYATARLVGSRRVAIIAAALTAFNPMFLFISASVNNDNLVTALGSVIFWQTVVMLRDGFSTRRSLVLALLLALAGLTKLSGFVLIPVVGLAALWLAYRRGAWRGFVTLVVLVGAAVLIICGWWLVRNLNLYGELFGTRMMVAVAGSRVEPFTLRTLIDEFEGFRAAYWGWFGAVDILTFRLYYPLMDAVTILALIGLALLVRRTRGRRIDVWILAAAILGGMVGVVAWTALTYASQGRLLFPYVAAISTLLALGLDELFGRVRLLRRLEVGLAGAYGVFALIVALVSIAPVYAPPTPLAALPPSATPVYARFGDVELVGYQTPDARYTPGDDVPITVYWHVLQPSSRDLSLYLHAVDPSGAAIGRIDSFPGAGRLRTTTWQAGAIYADSYRIPLDRAAQGRYGLRVQVGWWHYASGAVIDPTDANGAHLNSVMLNVGAFADGSSPALPADLTPTARVDFGGLIALIGYKLDGDSLTLVWAATGTPPDTYTVFVQVLDAAGKIAGQGDAPPDLPTRYWRSGERYLTTHTISYPTPPAPGTYRIVVGWYRPSDFARLGAPYPDSAYPLATITK